MGMLSIFCHHCRKFLGVIHRPEPGEDSIRGMCPECTAAYLFAERKAKKLLRSAGSGTESH
jgi:hypothetical protein